MKIVYVTAMISTGGVATYVKQLAWEVNRRGHHAKVIVAIESAASGRIAAEDLKKLGVDVVFIEASSGHSMRLIIRLGVMLWKFRPDLIHLNEALLMAAFPLMASSAPKLLTLHVYGGNGFKSKIISSVYGKLLSGVIGVSDSVVNVYQNDFCYFKGIPWRRIYNGIDLRRFTVAGAISSPLKFGKVYLTMTCRLSPDKHVDDAILVLAQLRKLRSDFDFELNVVGAGGEMNHLSSLAETLGLTRHIVFHGNLADVRPVLNRTHFLLVLSDAETFSFSALEAMACGVPVISYPIGGGFSELHKSGKTGLVSTTRTPESVATEILKLVDSGVLYSQLSECSRVESMAFSQEKTLSGTIDFYNELMSFKGN